MNEGEPEGEMAYFYSSSIDSGRLRGGAKALFCSFKFLLGIWNPVVNLCPGGPQREGGTKWICHKKFMITFPHTHVGNRYEEDLFPGQTGQDWLVAAVVGGSFQLTVYTVAWATPKENCRLYGINVSSLDRYKKWPNGHRSVGLWGVPVWF